MAPRRRKVSRKSYKKSPPKSSNYRKRGVQKRYKFVKRGVRRFARRASSRYGFDFLEPYLYDPTIVVFDRDMPRLIDSDGLEDVNASLPGQAVVVASNSGVVIPPSHAGPPVTHRTVSNRWVDDDIPNPGVVANREEMLVEEEPRYNLRSVVVPRTSQGVPDNYGTPADWKKAYKKTAGFNSEVTDLAGLENSYSYFKDRLDAIFREQSLDPINSPIYIDVLTRTNTGLKNGQTNNGNMLANMAWLELSRLHYFKKRAISNVIALQDGNRTKK